MAGSFAAVKDWPRPLLLMAPGLVSRCGCGRGSVCNREPRYDARTFTVGMDVEATAWLSKFLPHPSDSNTKGPRRGHLNLFFWRYAFALILDFFRACPPSHLGVLSKQPRKSALSQAVYRELGSWEFT